MEFKDYYAVLGVDADADDKTIKTAYRKLARQYHPDVSKHTDAEEKFKEISEAYEILHNSEKRTEYDQIRLARSRGYGSQSRQSGFNPEQDFSGHTGSNEDFADFFNSIFGSRDRNSGFQRSFYEGTDSQQGRPQRGRDLEMELPIMLEDTLADTPKTIEFTIPHHDEYGQPKDIKKSINVKIPAGVSDGERIRLKGQGVPGQNKAANGDLYLHIRLIPHPLFDVEGHNLIITVPLAPWEAALGAKVTLPTLSGKINLTIPPNSQSGKRLRIQGKGLIGKQGAGDLFATLKIVMPQKTTEDTKQLWAQLATQANFDPRAEWSNAS